MFESILKFYMYLTLAMIALCLIILAAQNHNIVQALTLLVRAAKFVLGILTSSPLD